jgi:hypothetical protein
VKYIGELVKFHVAPPIVPFTVLKVCLDGFKGHNGERGPPCSSHMYLMHAA